MAKSPNPIDKHVGSRVKIRRSLLNLSQEKLAAALGISFQQVQKYEKGTNRIGASRLQQISKILKAPPSYFFDGAPAYETIPQVGFAEESTPAYVSEFMASQEGLALNMAFARIKDPKVRRRLVDLAVALAPPPESDAPVTVADGLDGVR